jgi:hypothetical protein
VPILNRQGLFRIWSLENNFHAIIYVIDFFY